MIHLNGPTLHCQAPPFLTLSRHRVVPPDPFRDPPLKPKPA
jgi:hypothetical protein